MKKKSSILIITECPYSGILRAIIADAKVISKLGISITFLVPNVTRDRYGETSTANMGELSIFGKIMRIPLRRKYRYILSDIISFNRFLKKNSFDVVISYSGYAGKICRLLYKFKKIRFLIHAPHCIDFIRRKWNIRLVEKMSEYLLRNDCTKYFACSPSELNLISSKYKISSEKIILNTNATTLEKINTQIKIKKIKYQYVILGRLTPDKQVDKTLEVLELLNLSQHTIVIGDGILKKQLSDKFNKVQFFGNIPNEEVVNLLNCTKFIVSSSIIEGMPYSVLEAMMCGVVPILSDICGHRDIVINGSNGLIFQSKADCIDKLFYSQIMSDKEYNSMSENSIDTIKKLMDLKQKNLHIFFSSLL